MKAQGHSSTTKAKKA
jgi:hypothetical protein